MVIVFLFVHRGKANHTRVNTTVFLTFIFQHNTFQRNTGGIETNMFGVLSLSVMRFKESILVAAGFLAHKNKEQNHYSFQAKV